LPDQTGIGAVPLWLANAARDRKATIAYFTRIREFDTPRKAIYVPDFFADLEAGATTRRRQVVAHIRRAHADVGRERYDRPTQILGPGATPRDVWELWMYSYHVHLDKDKRAKAALEPYQQAYAKFISYRYAGDLYQLVTVVEAMLRDEDLDDRGVRMQILTIDPPFKDRVPPFAPARVVAPGRPAAR
jgi:hypothetical protein